MCLPWNASLKNIFSYILYGTDALELDVFSVLNVLNVDATVECSTSKPKGDQTGNTQIQFHSLIISCYVCPLLGFGLYFVIFCPFDAKARADEIEALKKTKLTLAGDWTHSSTFLNDAKLQTFEQLRRKTTDHLVTSYLGRKTTAGSYHDLGKSCLACSTKVCDRCFNVLQGILLWYRLPMSLRLSNIVRHHQTSLHMIDVLITFRILW